MKDLTKTDEITVFNAGGTIHFHRSGCRDIKKGINKWWSKTSDTFANLQLAIDCYVDDGDDDAPGWSEDDLMIHPCTKRRKK